MATFQQTVTNTEEGAQRLRDRFLNEYSNSDEVDRRDIERVRKCLSYVNKFLIQKFGDEDSAYEMMVNALKWRLTFGVNNLRYSNLEDSLIDMGLAYHHGTDRDSNTLVILNCHLHKKDPKKLPEMEKFFVFALESHARKYPDKKVTLIFNMSQCGLSNMDLDFVKIIINCFKFYFPNMLAAWKIIKSWLSEVAVRKIKFVTKSDITDYISPDQLMTVFGGEDDWEFNPQEYRRELQAENESIWNTDPLCDDGYMEGEEEEREGDINNDRQVRFAPGQPPSNQSRFGKDEDNEYYSTRSLDTHLLRGTAASPGYRRRMVNRFITQQSPSLPSSNSIDYGDLLSTQSLRHTTTGYVLISPSEELLFSGQSEQDLICTITLNNTSTNTIAYKIKTTAPKRYKVRPNINIIEPQLQANVQVQLIIPSGGGGQFNEVIAHDKFLIQTYQFATGTTLPDQTQLTNFWKDLNSLSIHEHRLKCRYTVERPPMIDTPVVGGDSNINEHKKDQTIATLNRKLDRLSTELNEMYQTMNYIKYIAMVTLLLILFILCVLLTK